MKKLILLFALNVVVIFSFSQNFQKLSQDYDAQMKNEKILYGHDTLVLEDKFFLPVFKNDDL
jgi:hypothetical protein